MQNKKDIQLLQFTYAAVLADTVAQLAKEDVLEKVIKRKKAEQKATSIRDNLTRICLYPISRDI
jgi:hypothetical protein